MVEDLKSQVERAQRLDQELSRGDDAAFEYSTDNLELVSQACKELGLNVRQLRLILVGAEGQIPQYTALRNYLQHIEVEQEKASSQRLANSG